MSSTEIVGVESVYEFQPCPENEIRLVTIAPASDHETDISCLITHYRREEKPCYDAISYSWGQEHDRSKIFCNERTMNVTRSCKAALKALRHTSEPQTVWIDAVCIDQLNTTEKSQQVARMSDVYVNASRTFIYLGDSGKIWDIYDDESEDSHWESLLERQWFTRTWVIQEVLLSRSLYFVIGNQRIAWLDLIALCDARQISRPELFELRAEVAHDYARRMPKSWAEQETDVEEGTFRTKEAGHTNLPYWRLLGFLDRTRHFECSDARDKLFAILPLFAKPTPQLLIPDYTKTLEQTYSDLSWFMLHYGQGGVLASAGSCGTLASWVVDWRLPLTAEKLEEAVCVSESAAEWRSSWRAGFQLRAQELLLDRITPDRVSVRGLEPQKVVSVVRRTCKRILCHDRTWHTIQLHVAVTTQETARDASVTCKIWREAEHILATQRRYNDVRSAIEETLAAKFQCAIKFKNCGLGPGNYARFIAWRADHITQTEATTACLELEKVLAAFDSTEDPEPEGISQVTHFIERHTRLSRGRCVLQIADGTLVLGPKSTQIGDLVCVLFGFSTPFVLRKVEEHHVLLGECCAMSPMMEGAEIDAWAAKKSSTQETREYVLI